MTSSEAGTGTPRQNRLYRIFETMAAGGFNLINPHERQRETKPKLDPLVERGHMTQDQLESWERNKRVSRLLVHIASEDPQIGMVIFDGLRGSEDIGARCLAAHMVGGLNWAGDPCGIHDSDYTKGTCVETAKMPTDPDNQLTMSFHTYGPNHTVCTYQGCWQQVYDAAEAKALPIITGELGQFYCNDTSYLDNYMGWADGVGVSYVMSFWDVFYSTTGTYSCSPSDPTSSTDLISNYGTGAPANVAPFTGADYKAHLLSENP